MRKRIIYIILAALLILALTLLLWFWFFGRGPSTGAPPNLFGTGGQGSGQGATSTGSGGNNQAPIGSNAGSGGGPNTQTPIGPGGGGGYISPYDPGSYIDPYVIAPDVIWNFPFGGSGGGSNIFFDPTPITGVEEGEITGNPYITKLVGADGKPIDLFSGLGVVIGGCIAQYAITNLATKASPIILSDTARALAGKVAVYDGSGNASTQAETITQCLTRTLGRLAVQAVTDSTVNWINSGFNGKPAYVENYEKFFTGVADQAAGEFLQGSNFAFLCSPFKLQVRIAIAQSYARRSYAPSCTLTQAVGNVKNFLNGGGFNDGGWGGLISFTTEPANNPFGAYMILQGQFSEAQRQAVANANQEVSNASGFLSKKDKDGNIITPGRAIVSSFDATTQASLDTMQVGESIDQILAALQNALISRIFQSGGLAGINKNTGSDNADTPAQKAANELMEEIRNSVTAAQQYGSVKQRIITDIQTAQNNLVQLQNCWLVASSSPTLTASQILVAQAGANLAAQKFAELEALVATHNFNIEKANNSIVAFQELQTDLLLATIASDVNEVKAEWDGIKATDSPHVYAELDVTLAQQDRTTIQSSLASQNIDTGTRLQQCYALGQ